MRKMTKKFHERKHEGHKIEIEHKIEKGSFNA